MHLRALTQERARPARIRERPDAGWLAVATVCFGAFMGQLDASRRPPTNVALLGVDHRVIR